MRMNRSTDRGMSKRKRGERGIASFSGKYPEELYYINFDENNKPIGFTRKKFMSWYGMMVQHMLPYHIETGKVDDRYFEELWLETKRAWKIMDNCAKDFMRKKAVKLGTNFRSRLATKYVYKGLNACHKYTFLDPDKWEAFVLERTSAKAKDKSKKAKTSNAKRKFIPHLGRSGWAGMEEKKDVIWPQLLKKHDNLKHLQSHRSKMYLLGCAVQNKKTKLYDLPPDAIEDFKLLYEEEQKMIKDGSFFLNKEDPLVRLLGPEHGGRARTISDIIGHTRVHGGLYKNVNHDRGWAPRVDTGPTFCGSSYGSGGRLVDYPPIESMTQCVLLLNVGDDSLVEVANGMAWPTSASVIHHKPIMDGCVKVNVDKIVDMHGNLPVHSVTRTNEVKYVKDMFHEVVQWPRHFLKLMNNETASKSTSATRMASSAGSPSCTGASLQIPTDDTAMTPYHRSQAEVVNQYLELQTQDVMMQPEEVQGSLMNMILNFGNPQSGFQNPFELHALNPKSNPNHEANSEQEPNFETETTESESESESEDEDELVTMVEPAFEDPALAPALELIKGRPQPVQDLVDQLTILIGDRYVVRVGSPKEMYPEQVVEAIPYSELLQIFLNGWLDVSLLHWFAMHFFEKPNCQCAFLDPTKINGPKCIKEPKVVENHIKDISWFHSKKNFILAPYLQGGHWSLIILHPASYRGYIVDSMRNGKTKRSYTLVSIINKVFGKRYFKWEMVQCKQQEDTWECGYMVIKHIKEFVEHIQYDIVKELWKEDGKHPQSKIEELVLKLMPELIHKAFNGLE
ncbi:putative Ulp1 protease family catalytic domain, papain-like cysteine peptidase superfamily [Helianthus annuus]|nr:putative Ulp1 protease family catalytic domain, papain-like cysteine peptidase superfamily [Helianthus annuus]